MPLWSWNVDIDHLTFDRRAYDMWGVPEAKDITFEILSAREHPADLDSVGAAFNATRAISGP